MLPLAFPLLAFLPLQPRLSVFLLAEVLIFIIVVVLPAGRTELATQKAAQVLASATPVAEPHAVPQDNPQRAEEEGEQHHPTDMAEAEEANARTCAFARRQARPALPYNICRSPAQVLSRMRIVERLVCRTSQQVRAGAAPVPSRCVRVVVEDAVVRSRRKLRSPGVYFLVSRDRWHV